MMHVPLRWVFAGLLVAGASALSDAAPPYKVLAIGDSMTEEYAYELSFSAPGISTTPNTYNWPEILAARRSDWLTMGGYIPGLLAYPDLRNGGYKYNYGVPGFRSWDWVAVCQSTWRDTLSGDPVISLRYPTRLSLTTCLTEVNAVVIFLGGNDLKSNYTGIFNDDTPPALLDQVVSNVAIIHDFVRGISASVPVVIATVPDIGVTPNVAANYNDPTKLARARARVAAMNTSLASMAIARHATVARIDSLTDQIFDQVPMHLNGTTFIYPPASDNSPREIFCKDGFHPATMAQALISNVLIDALNQALGLTAANSIPRFTNRYILETILGLNPDQPFLDWAAGAGDFLADPDGDGLPNLTEYALATPPTSANAPFTFGAGGILRFKPSAEGLKFAELKVEESPAMTGWQPVPANRISIDQDGNWQVAPAATNSGFYRLAVSPRP